MNWIGTTTPPTEEQETTKNTQGPKKKDDKPNFTVIYIVLYVNTWFIFINTLVYLTLYNIYLSVIWEWLSVIKCEQVRLSVEYGLCISSLSLVSGV